ncbi:MAG: hypothetical protein ACOX5G_08645 [Kiritimatiellia bacterium]|jgi:hypothetical protein
MAGKDFGESFDGQVFGRCRKDALDALIRLGRDESRRSIVTFQNEFPTVFESKRPKTAKNGAETTSKSAKSVFADREQRKSG